MYQTHRAMRHLTRIGQSALVALLSAGWIGSAYSNPMLSDPPDWFSPESPPVLETTPSPRMRHSVALFEELSFDVGGYLDEVAQKLDMYLGDESIEVKPEPSELRLFLPLTLYDDPRVASKPRFRLYLDLPRLRHRAKLVVSSFDETDPNVTEDGSETLIEASKDRENVGTQGTSIATQYELKSTQRQKLRFDLGLRVSQFQPNPYVRLRHLYQKPLAIGVMSRTEQNLIYERQRHLVWDLRQTLDYPKQQNLWRSVSRGTWLNDEERFLLSQRFSVFYQISPKRVRSYFLEGRGYVENSQTHEDQLFVGMNWRERLYKQRLFAEVEPRLSWFDEDRFRDANLSLNLVLEMRLGKE
ncbi:MAG: hypothetical protein JXR44_06300 [Thiotrichales bacterium]|nr:hypothetical protein [Thiotrichales bacterium]